MKHIFSDWDEDLPPEANEDYDNLIRSLDRKTGFGLYFVQCTPAEADQVIGRMPQDLPRKKIAVLRLVGPIDNLYQRVHEIYQQRQFEVLLITGLEYSLYKYEKRKFGEITEGQFSNLSSVPPILNHLNQQRERFRDDFPVAFVFLLRSFSINYLIHRSPDFFDWRSAVYELPTTPEVVEEEAFRLIQEGDYGEYLKLANEQKIEKILEIQDLLAEKYESAAIRGSLQFELGSLLHSAQEYKSALAAYNESINILPEYPEAWYRRGNALGSLELHAEALASFEQAVRIQPNYYQAWYNRSITLYKLKRYTEALASFEQAIKIKPDYAQAWFKRGVTLNDLQRYSEAITSFDQALKIKPDFQPVWYNRGVALMNLQRCSEAIASFNQALQLQPYPPSRGIIIGDLSPNSVKKPVTKPDFDIIWYSKACCYAQQGDTDQALANLRQAIAQQPEKYREMAKIDPYFDSLREDVYFQSLVREGC